jgi:CRISPR-associated RAMP protein (TIGR02581 family)
MPAPLTHEYLSGRYQFIGTVVLETGLHIGGGRSATLTDAPVMRTAQNVPYIPGSSFKGALRSAVERLAPNLHHLHPPVTSCQLIERGDAACLTITPELRERLQQLQEDCETAQRTGQSYHRVATSDRDVTSDHIRYVLQQQICTEEEVRSSAFARQLPYRFITHHLCDTCKLFGAPVLAAKVRVSDLPCREPWVEMTEIRDGVGIDRDTETARAKIKFDLEVVPAQTTFMFRLDAENLAVRDLGLLCIGLQEFRAGLVPLGGRSTRGLGQCQLVLSDVYSVDLADSAALLRYLTAANPNERMTRHDPEAFISERIRALLVEGHG